jgi:hypothetical protein
MSDFRRIVVARPSFTLHTSRDDIEVAVKPAGEEMLSDYGLKDAELPRGQLGWIRLLMREDTSFASIALNGSAYLLSLVAISPRITYMQAWKKDPDNFTMFDISYCDFTCRKSTLHIFDTKTRPRYRGRGLNASLQRFAYLLAGRPRQIVRHQTMRTNPDFGTISEAFLDSGFFLPFHPGPVAESMGRRFDVNVTGMKILNPNEIKLKLDSSYAVSVRDSSTFNIRYSVIPLDAG